jgi:hypothetical protein
LFDSTTIPKDRRLALRHRNRRSFVIGPDGRMREFNKKEYRSEILFEDLPSDPNPRNKDRANTVSPIELPKDEKFRNEREPLLPTEEYHVTTYIKESIKQCLYLERNIQHLEKHKYIFL